MKYIIFVIVFILSNITKANAQTWEIGYPDASKVIATLIDGKLIIKGTGDMKNYPRQKIWKDSIKIISIEKGVTNIGNFAFYDCRKLKSIIIPEGVTSIGEFAFQNCINLEDITIPKSVKVIKKNAFQRCSSLKSIIIPNNVAKIGEYTFFECFNLKSIRLGSEITQIGSSTFRDCRNLSSITIPKNVTKIGTSTFLGCTNLKTIEVQDGNLKFISINGVLFNRNKKTLIAYPNGKKGSYRIPKSVSVIENRAFASSKINKIHISKNIEIIKNGAFRYCSNLKKIKIPNNVKKIGILVFANCDQLKKIKFGRSISDIDMYTLNQSKNLLKIKVNKNNSKFSSKKGILYSKSKDTLIMYPAGKKGRFIIPKYVSSIKKGAFANCQGLTEIIISENISSIQELAFQYDKNLRNITNKSLIPQKIKKEVFLGININRINLYVHKQVLDKYKNAEVWKNFGQIKIIN